MLPSLVVDEVCHGIAETLRAQFEPSTELFKDAVRRLIDNPAWIKGPYVQLGMPFVAGSAGKTFFDGFNTEYPAHKHQELAWQRCGIDKKSTLVATGTGSGKTECFLYPVLDHVAHARKEDVPGIKAIIIYPMNALADDQAGRIAELVHQTSAFAGIRAGLFVGSGKTKYKPSKAGEDPEQDTVEMGPQHIITDKDVLRDNPPDILLTNYKMLDFLMIRPKDQPLWRFNKPDTLHYLIVDELHTFDGAQGTDLAMLIRRLRFRLQCEETKLICVGTSATLGDSGDTVPLREYAGQVFATTFDKASVITESRKGFDDFIGDRVVEHLISDDDTVLTAIAPKDFSSQQKAVEAFLPALFTRPDTLSALQAGIDTARGRVQLGEELKKHLLFQTLLRTAAHTPVTIDDIADKVQRTLSTRLTPHVKDIITALLTLVGWARAPHAGQKVRDSTAPEKLNHFVSLRVQAWFQELRRVLATVSRDADGIELMAEANILANLQQLRLPVVQCSNCRTTGWLTLKQPQESRIEKSPDVIYTSFFARNPDPFLTRIYPRFDDDSGSVRLMTPVLNQTLCGQCGTLGNDKATQCASCQSDGLLPVHVVSPNRQKTWTETLNGKKEQHQATIHDDTCPVCADRGNQRILGARTTTIAAYAVERLWSAPLNNHKKLILFSDSVQDAAHRAGFIESKTENHLMRAGLAKAMAIMPATQPWSEAFDALGKVYLDPASPLAMSPRDFVAQFIPPGLEWLRDWKELMAKAELPGKSNLPHMLSQRMQWRAVEELTHLAGRGPTLSKVGVAVVFPKLVELHALCDPLAQTLKDTGGGLEGLTEEAVFHWAVGFVLMLIHAGGIFHAGLEYVAETGDFRRFEFAPSRKTWIPHRRNAPTPRFVTAESGRHGFLNLEERSANPLLAWAQLALRLNVYSPGIITLAYEELLKALDQAEIGHFVQLDERGQQARVFGLSPKSLSLCQNLRRLVTPSGAQSIWVPDESADALIGLPAWNSPAEVFEQETIAGTDWWNSRLKGGDVTRVIAHEHTGLLERDERVELQNRFMAKPEQWEPWFENLLSATPTLEMGIDIGALSSVMLGGVPPNQANFIQRIGRAGRLDGNAAVFTIADASQDGHDQYYFSNPLEMLHGAVEAPAIYLGAAEVLRRQIYAFFFDHWVSEETPTIPDKLSEALDQVAKDDADQTRFPYNYLDFINRKEPEMFDTFCRMLGDNLTSNTREKLEGFIAGSEQHKNLRARFLAFFEESHAERESWKDRRKRINAELGKLRKRPEDEQTQAEIETLEKERASLSQRVQQLNNEHLLEAMTNASLLPNYAFPEEGVSLTTIIHGAKKGSGEEYSIPVHRYSRPAHAALAEFAPRNTFFAHKSKVEIDQIDMSVEPPLDHRFCANCHYVIPASDPDAQRDQCPHCGNTRWSDASQIRPLLRLKRAVANVDRTDKTRITESDENRTQRYYIRKLLMNFDASDVRSAWTFESSQAIYGFEFIAKALFHDINTGQPTQGNSPNLQTIIAGDDSSKAGFSLCSECGKVQPYFRNGQDEERKQEHTPDCRQRNATGTEHLKDEIFLFREFESECLRIMVPRGFGSGDRTTYSFMSALQLGLRKRFGGKVDHLRFETMDEAKAGGDSGKTYILIYDSVPGGTGYLQQLLSGEADTLTEVLTVAYEVIRDCECKDKPDVDGCYQCVFQYRQGRNRKNISRIAALEILDELIEGDFERKQVRCLSEIYINPSFGSELERRFLPALKALGGQMDLDNTRFPSVQITQEIRAGKTAYLLAIGSNKYWVETQVPIEDAASGQTLCQPDFVISATRTGSPMVPIAVFVDGWEYHRKSLPEDARKRSTLMLRGDFRVWSVTHEDIEAALKLKAGTDLESPLSVLATESGKSIPNDKVPDIHPNDLQSNAIAQLIRTLTHGDTLDFDPSEYLQSGGQHLLIRTVLRGHEVTEEIKQQSKSVMALLPEWLTESSGAVYLRSPGVGLVQWVGRATPQFVTGATRSGGHPLAGALVLNDSGVEDDPKSIRVHWRHWLRLANLLQSTPGVALVTRSMLDKKQQLSIMPPQAEAPVLATTNWNRFLGEGAFLERLKPGFLILANSDVLAPDEVGVEFEGDSGYRAAEAVWESAHVAFLTAGQTEYVASWKAAGYLAVEENENWWHAVDAAIKGRKQ